MVNRSTHMLPQISAVQQPPVATARSSSKNSQEHSDAVPKALFRPGSFNAHPVP